MFLTPYWLMILIDDMNILMMEKKKLRCMLSANEGVKGKICSLYPKLKYVCLLMDSNLF